MKLFNRLTSLVLVGIAALFAASQADAQISKVIPLPFTFLTGGGTDNVSQTTTNLTAGWAGTSTVTNVTTSAGVTNGVVTLTSVTNIVTNSATIYADFSAVRAPWVVLQSDYKASAGTSNEVITVARSVTGVNFDTVNNINVTNACNGTTLASGTWQIDMRGYPYGRIVQWRFADTNNTHFLTNVGTFISTSDMRQTGTP